MSASANNLLIELQTLLAVQATDSRIDRDRAELAALDTGASTAALYNRVKAEAEARRAKATTAQAEQKDAEMRLQSIEEKTAKENKTLYSGTVTGARELENLQREIEMLGRQRGDAEERVLLAMEGATEAVAAAEKAEGQLAQLAAHYRKVRAAYKDRHAALTADIEAAEKERAEAARPLSPALLSRYDGIRARKGGIGAAALLPDGNCNACHTRINSNLEADVRAGQSPQLCEYCGRILVPVA